MFLGPEVPQQVGLFSAFRHCLSSLSIWSCHVTSSALIALINYFPLLMDLDLHELTHETDGEPLPQLSRPLRGRLTIIGCRTEHRALFKNLSSPPPELDELVLYQVHMPTCYDDIVSAHGGDVKYLVLRGDVYSHPRTL